MNKTGLRQIRLDPKVIADKDRMTDFMKRELSLPESFHGNLDALADLISEVSEETVFELETGVLDRFDKDERLNRFLRMISRSSKENPHLHLYLTDRWGDNCDTGTPNIN